MPMHLVQKIYDMSLEDTHGSKRMPLNTALYTMFIYLPTPDLRVQATLSEWQVIFTTLRGNELYERMPIVGVSMTETEASEIWMGYGTDNDYGVAMPVLNLAIRDVEADAARFVGMLRSLEYPVLAVDLMRQALGLLRKTEGPLFGVDNNP